MGICRKIKLSLRVLPKRAHTTPIQHPHRTCTAVPHCPSLSRHVRSSEHFSHWLTFGVLYVAPVADTMFDDRDGRGLSSSFPIMSRFFPCLDLSALFCCSWETAVLSMWRFDFELAFQDGNQQLARCTCSYFMFPSFPVLP